MLIASKYEEIWAPEVRENDGLGLVDRVPLCALDTSALHCVCRKQSHAGWCAGGGGALGCAGTYAWGIVDCTHL